MSQLVCGLPFRLGAAAGRALLPGLRRAAGAKICVDTIVQEQVDDDFRGRVFSFYDTLFNVTFVVAAVAAAFMLPRSGRPQRRRRGARGAATPSRPRRTAWPSCDAGRTSHGAGSRERKPARA